MSVNLSLAVHGGPRATRAAFDLEQTPTEVTRRMTATCRTSADFRRAYGAWVEGLGVEWAAEHLASLDRYLARYPDAEWGET